MKTIVLILLLTLLLGLIGVSTTAALATFAPFHPGQALFGFQDWAEHTYEIFIGSPDGRAQYSLTLLERRIVDLEQALGTSYEGDSVIALSNEINHVLQLMSHVTVEGEAGLRAVLIQDLDRLLAALDQTTYFPAAALQLQTEFRAKVLALKALIENTANSLAGLAAAGFGDDQALPAASQDGAIDLVKTGIDSRIVPFPPGSPGALHLFFPLDGKHAELDCQSCHPQGDYRGTPDLCTDCHNVNKPADHFAGQCSLCHTTAAWLPASFDHSVSAAVNCQSCHQGDRPANHYPGQCSACHTTAAWLPATFNHEAAVALDCQSCHLSARPANHYSGQCAACHSTSAWLPATFDHQAAGAVDCQSCHLDRKPANHFSGQCSACHSTNAWTPASFNHQIAGATDCQACHSRPANHFAGQCSDCHSTTTWQGATFNHSFPLDHGNANSECAKCHPSGTGSFSCFTCHNQAEMTKKHEEEGIPDYIARCLQCHGDGRKHEESD